jgi:hypothetical protein
MFDNFVYRILDWIVSRCGKIKEWKIQKSLPRPKPTAQQWAKEYKKFKEKTYKNNDDCQ